MQRGGKQQVMASLGRVKWFYCQAEEGIRGASESLEFGVMHKGLVCECVCVCVSVCGCVCVCVSVCECV